MVHAGRLEGVMCLSQEPLKYFNTSSCKHTHTHTLCRLVLLRTIRSFTHNGRAKQEDSIPQHPGSVCLLAPAVRHAEPRDLWLFSAQTQAPFNHTDAPSAPAINSLLLLHLSHTSSYSQIKQPLNIVRPGTCFMQVHKHVCKCMKSKCIFNMLSRKRYKSCHCG